MGMKWMKSSYQGINKGTSRIREVRRGEASYYASSIVKRAVYLLNFSRNESRNFRANSTEYLENCSTISKLESGGLRKEETSSGNFLELWVAKRISFRLRDLYNFSSIFFLGLLCLNRGRPIRTVNFENTIRKFEDRSYRYFLFKPFLSLRKLRKTI